MVNRGQVACAFYCRFSAFVISEFTDAAVNSTLLGDWTGATTGPEVPGFYASIALLPHTSIAVA